MADIPVLRGWGDDIADLGNGLTNLIDPNKKMHDALKAAALQNPQLLAQLGEMERSSPGTLQKMGMGSGGIMDMLGKGHGLIDQIAGTPLTPEMQNARAQQTANIEQTNASAGNLRANTRRSDTLLPGEEKKTNAEGDLAAGTVQQEIAAKNAKFKLDSETNAKQLDDVQTTIKKFPSLASIDMAKYAADVFNGKPTDPDITNRIAIAGKPGQEAVQQYLDAMKERGSWAKDYGLQHLRSKDEMVAAAGLMNQSIEQSKQHEGLIKDEILKIGGDDLNQKILSRTANPQDDNLKNSAEAIAAREKLARIEQLNSQLDEVKKGYNQLTTVRDNILSNVPGVQKSGGMTQTLGPVAQKLKAGIESGEVDTKSLSATAAFKGLTKDEQDELLKLKKKGK